MKSIYAQISKVDEEKRLVYGIAAAEVPDRSGEILDYEASKPYFKKWVEETLEASNGQSHGNLRAMHGKVAAGKVVGIDFDDETKSIPIVAKVVDDAEWKKVLEGVYTGFSIGGSYVGEKKVEKVGGREVKRYIAAPSEISLVDRPCIPTATFFEVQKADGSTVKVEFLNKGKAEDEEVAEGEDPTPSTTEASIPDAEKADSGPVEYQVDGTEADIASLAKLMHENKLNVAQVVEMVSASLASAAEVEKAEKAKKEILSKEESGELTKGMYAVSALAELLDRLQTLANAVKYEEENERDYTSLLPDKMADAVRQLSGVLQAMVEEEVAEMVGDRPMQDVPSEVLALADKIGGLEKLKARDVATNKATIEKFFTGDLKKAEEKVLSKDEVLGDLQKLVAEAVEPLQKIIAEQAEKIQKLEALPLQPKGVLKVISKSADALSGEGEPEVAPVVKLDGSVDVTATEIKKVHQSGGKPLAWGPGGPVY